MSARAILAAALACACSWPATAARAQGPAPLPNPPAAESTDDAKTARLDAILADLERRGAEARSLDIRFDRADEAPRWKLSARFQGRLLWQEPGLACLDVNQAGESPGAKATFFERVILSKEDLAHLVGPNRQVWIYPRPDGPRPDPGRAAREAELFDLSGPLMRLLRVDRPPFLFRPRVEDLRGTYRISLVRESADEVVVRLIPRSQADRALFAQADLTLDPKAMALRAAVLTGASGQDTQSYRFTEARPNAAINPANFQAEPTPAGWEVSRMGREAQTQAQAPAPPTAAPTVRR